MGKVAGSMDWKTTLGQRLAAMAVEEKFSWEYGTRCWDDGKRNPEDDACIGDNKFRGSKSSSPSVSILLSYSPPVDSRLLL